MSTKLTTLNILKELPKMCRNLSSGIDIPKIKFNFKEEDLKKLTDLGISTSYLKDQEESDYIINVPDIYLFGKKLADLINLYSLNQNKYLGYEVSPSNCLNSYVVNGYLFLKMTPYDFLDIYSFLDKQISFLKNDNIFDKYNTNMYGYTANNIVGHYQDYYIVAEKQANNVAFETDTNMSFKLVDKETRATYDLPMIHYAISDNTCYIYGLQNKEEPNKDKKIERALYKLNKGIENNNNHPSFVLALKTFIDMLNDNGISDIKVPLLEVLNYDYHAILGNRTKEMFDRQWSNNKPEDELEEEAYTEDLKNVEKFAGKEDIIAHIKTDNLVNLFLRVEEQFENISIEEQPYELIVKSNTKTR